MAIVKGVGIGRYRKRVKVRRPGVNSKNRHSNNKHSKYYVKKYVGQGGKR